MKTIVRIMIVIMSGLTLGACSSSKLESDFKQGCRSIGGTRSFCSCSYEKVEGYFGRETMIAVSEGKKHLPENWAIVVQKAGASCMDKL